MKHYLKNSNGLYLMQMGVKRSDVSFTSDISLAMSFTDKSDAEHKRSTLPMLKLSIESI